MTSIWTNYDNKGDRIIAFANGTIYKANPKPDEIENIVRDMQMNDFTAPGLFGIPLHYIKEIRLQEGNDYIQILFGQDSEEHLKIKDDARREEIFTFLKDNLSNTSYAVDRYSKIKAGKKAMIALAVVGALLLYSLYLAWELSVGTTFIASGRLGGLLIGIASLGITKVLLIYGTLTAIAATSMILKMKNPPVIHVIRLVR